MRIESDSTNRFGDEVSVADDLDALFNKRLQSAAAHPMSSFKPGARCLDAVGADPEGLSARSPGGRYPSAKDRDRDYLGRSSPMSRIRTRKTTDVPSRIAEKTIAVERSPEPKRS